MNRHAQIITELQRLRDEWYRVALKRPGKKHAKAAEDIADGFQRKLVSYCDKCGLDPLHFM